MHTTSRPAEATAKVNKRAWQTPTLRPIGPLGEVLKGGSPKVTVVTGDPGEPQKVPGNDL